MAVGLLWKCHIVLTASGVCFNSLRFQRRIRRSHDWRPLQVAEGSAQGRSVVAGPSRPGVGGLFQDVKFQPRIGCLGPRVLSAFTTLPPRGLMEGRCCWE